MILYADNDRMKTIFRLKPLLIMVLTTLLLITAFKTPDMWTLLANGDERAMAYFLGEFGFDATDKDGKTPLHYAAEQNDSKLANFFINLGVDVNAYDNSNQTPLGICAENGFTEIAEAIVRNGGDIHKQAKNNNNDDKHTY